MEVPRVQRTSPPLPPSSRYLIPNRKYVPGPIPQSTCCSHRTVSHPPLLPPSLTFRNRFIAFIAGSFAAVLLLASLVDPDLFLNFEITPHRTVLFYIGIFATILAVSRSMIPDAHNVFDPEILMREVIRHTHYMPAEWKDSLHSVKVHAEFGQLFAMKAMIFVQEILSVVLTPLVLWFSLPDCAPAITDFFREFTVHVDGLGYVCSFAVFDFKRHGNVNVSITFPVSCTHALMHNDGTVRSADRASGCKAPVQGRKDGEILPGVQSRSPRMEPPRPCGLTLSLPLGNLASKPPAISRESFATGITDSRSRVWLSEHVPPASAPLDTCRKISVLRASFAAQCGQR